MTPRNARRAWPAFAAGLTLALAGGARLNAVQVPRAAATPAAVATGTGRLAGVIVDAHGQPVHRAIVTLTAPDLPAELAAVTTDEGQFSFDRLPAGHFTLTAVKPAYLKVTYGAVRLGGAGTPITLAADQAVTNLRLMLPHGGAISGVIRDLRGDPVSDLQVSVIRTDAPAVTVPLRSDAARTDDRGAFRAFGLPPGTYIVSTSPGMSGGLGEVGQMSVADVDEAFARLRQPARGPAASSAPRASAPSSIVRPTRPFSTAPVFYPGVAAASAAQTITLALGEERADVDFVYQLTRSAAVSGTVAGVDALANVQVTLSPEGVVFQLPPVLGGGPLSQRGEGPGTFKFANVTPGKYTLMVRTGGPQPGGARGAGGPAASPAPVMFAKTTVEVDGNDIDGIALALQPALQVSGRLVFQATSMTPPDDLTKIRVRLTSARPGGELPVMTGGLGIAQVQTTMGVIQPDGTFVIAGVLPGPYRISTVGQPAGWRERSAVMDNRDLFDTPLDVAASDVTGVEITLSDQHSHLTGRLLLATGTPASAYFVVAFPADRAQWATPSRRMKSTRPATDGQFRLDDLPAGSYCLAAVTDADQETWQSPAFLTQLLAAGVQVTIGDGETRTQDLKVSK